MEGAMVTEAEPRARGQVVVLWLLTRPHMKQINQGEEGDGGADGEWVVRVEGTALRIIKWAQVVNAESALLPVGTSCLTTRKCHRRWKM